MDKLPAPVGWVSCNEIIITRITPPGGGEAAGGRVPVYTQPCCFSAGVWGTRRMTNIGYHLHSRNILFHFHLIWICNKKYYLSISKMLIWRNKSWWQEKNLFSFLFIGLVKIKNQKVNQKRKNRILKKMKVMLNILEIKRVFLKYCLLYVCISIHHRIQACYWLNNQAVSQ